jgi:lipopolysaccharide export system protein LptC
MGWFARTPYDNFHSRLVAWLKILLPLAALAILSTLFLVSNTVTPEDAIPYSEADVADRVREPRLTDASYAGMTTDGAALTLKAATARPGTPGSPDAGSAQGISGALETPDGGWSRITAAEVRLDEAAHLIVLTGGVSLSNSTGYAVTLSGMEVALDRTRLSSTGGPVQASGPAGQIEAGAMELTPKGADYLLVFKSGVRLLYQPEQKD